MQLRHSEPENYFKEQSYTTKNHIIPFLKRRMALSGQHVVAEIGCGIGGNMFPFLEMGCTVYGIDFSSTVIDIARRIYSEKESIPQPYLIQSNIYDVIPSSLPKFDLIVMRDVLEHIHDQKRFIEHIAKFIKPGGTLFLAFPPFMMPFAGHQQMCTDKVACRVPYFHLLPRSVYAWVLGLFGESREKINGLLEIKDTRIHLWKFHHLVAESQFTIAQEDLYLINPNYEIKFGLKPRKIPFFLNIPVIRELFITTCYIQLVKT